MNKAADDLNLERLAAIQKMAKAGYWEIDLESGDFRWSEGACSIFGLDPVEQKPCLNDFLERVHFDDRDWVKEMHDRQARNPEPFEISYTVLMPDNTRKAVLEVNAVSTDNRRKPTLCRFLLQDITIRKEAQQQADITYESWKQLIDAIDDYILILDTDMRIVSTNRAIRELLGKNFDDLVGRSCHEVFYGSSLDCPSVFCPVKEAAARKESRSREISNDYLQKVLLVTTTPYMDTNGDLLGYIHFCKDITERKMLETRLRQNEKMEAIGTLAGGIAHDFNNILGAIYGFTELALLDSQPDTGLRDNLNQIRRAADRAKDLIGQLLTFSRETETNQQPVLLSPIVKETIKLLRASLPSTIEIKRNVRTDQEKIMADPAQIHQIIMNLCTNAVQAMDEDQGGRITVSLKPVILNAEESRNIHELDPGRYLLLSISDTGRGMQQEEMDRIFDPFFTTREKGQGTGMGLTVVHGIVTGSNGAITVESTPGKGTTFSIYFPVLEEHASRPEKPAIINLPGGDEHILLVDDEEEIVTMAKKLLIYLGYQVTTFTDSEEALEAYCAAPQDFDLLITDLIMPRLTGYELSRRALEIRPDLPVMLCTGYKSKISEEEMRKIGIRSILYKPLTLQQLGNTVRNTIDGERQ